MATQPIDSILTSIKKLLGIEEAYEHFDQDIMIYINGTFMTLPDRDWETYKH